MKDPQQTNSYVIKLMGKAELPNELEIGHNYSVSIQGSITAKTESDNEDGSSTFYYKFEPVVVEVITEKGERIRAKDTRGMSKQLRSCIWKNWQDANENIDFEDYYQSEMKRIIKAEIEGFEFKSGY